MRQDEEKNEHVVCLPDYGRICPALAQLIGAEYVNGSFEEANERFCASGRDEDEWVLKGELGRLAVKFEKHEGYYFSSFSAREPQFQKGKELLWEHYLRCGGNPNDESPGRLKP